MKSSICRGVSTLTGRSFSQSVRQLAPEPAGKKKVKIGFKKATREKVKKAGKTHHVFEDAVRLYKSNKFQNISETVKLHPELTAESLQIGHVFKYNREVQKGMNAIGAFKKYQHEEISEEPITLVSKSTSDIYNAFIPKLSGSSTNNRICLVGEKGVGKSTIISQLQALAVSAYKEDVVLLHLDHPEKIVEGTSSYFFNKKRGEYQQPMMTKRWIKALRETNKEVFQKMPLSRDVSFTAKKVDHNLKKGENTLYDYVLLNHDFGSEVANDAFQFFVEELQVHSQKFPVFVSVDNFNALCTERYTKYFHPDMKPIYYSEFETGRFIAELVSGKLSFAKGGVLLAECKDAGESTTLKVGLKLMEHDAYMKDCDAKFAENVLLNGGVTAMPVKPLTPEEVGTLVQAWADSGILVVRDLPRKEKYASSGAAFLVLPEPENTNDERLDKLKARAYVFSAGKPRDVLKYCYQYY